MFSFLNRVYPNFRKIANAVAANPNRPNAIKPIGDKFNNMPKATGANGKYNLNDARQKYQMQVDAINKGQVKLPNYINVGDTSKMSPRMQQFLAEQQKRIAIDKLNESTYKNELKNIRPEDLWRNPDGSYSYNSPITGKEHKITKEDAKALNWDANQVAQIRDPLHRNRKHYGEGVFDDDAYNAYIKNRADPNVAVFNDPAYKAYTNKLHQRYESFLPQQQANAAAINGQVKQQPTVNNNSTQPTVNKYRESPKYDPNNPAYQWQGNLDTRTDWQKKFPTWLFPKNVNYRFVVDNNFNQYPRYPNDLFTNEQLDQQKQIDEQYREGLKINLKKNLAKLDALINAPKTTQAQKQQLLQKRNQLKLKVENAIRANKRRDDLWNKL